MPFSAATSRVPSSASWIWRAASSRVSPCAMILGHSKGRPAAAGRGHLEGFHHRPKAPRPAPCSNANYRVWKFQVVFSSQLDRTSTDRGGNSQTKFPHETRGSPFLLWTRARAMPGIPYGDDRNAERSGRHRFGQSATKQIKRDIRVEQASHDHSPRFAVPCQRILRQSDGPRESRQISRPFSRRLPFTRDSRNGGSFVSYTARAGNASAAALISPSVLTTPGN